MPLALIGMVLQEHSKHKADVVVVDVDAWDIGDSFKLPTASIS